MLKGMMVGGMIQVFEMEIGKLIKVEVIEKLEVKEKKKEMRFEGRKEMQGRIKEEIEV